MDLVWLTYDELADRFGIERESARQQVKRKRWARRPGNDGKVRIGVPEEVLSTRTAPEGATEAPVLDPAQGAQVPVQPPAHDPGVTAVLSRHIERLEAEIEALKQERADALARATDRDEVATRRDIIAVQVAALQGVFQAEKQRMIELQVDRDGLRADRDRWAAQAERLAVARFSAPQSKSSRSWWPWRRSAS